MANIFSQLGRDLLTFIHEKVLAVSIMIGTRSPSQSIQEQSPPISVQEQSPPKSVHEQSPPKSEVQFFRYGVKKTTIQTTVNEPSKHLVLYGIFIPTIRSLQMKAAYRVFGFDWKHFDRQIPQSYFSPYHDFEIDRRMSKVCLSKVCLSKVCLSMQAITTLLCYKLGTYNSCYVTKKLRASNGSAMILKQVFRRVFRQMSSQFDASQSNLFFTLDKQLVSVKKIVDYYGRDIGAFEITLRTNDGSSKKKTNIQVYDEFFSSRNIEGKGSIGVFQRDPNSIESPIIYFADSKGNQKCVFQVSHNGLTLVPIQSTLAHRHFRPNISVIENQSICLFHPGSESPFVIYTIQEGCICYQGKYIEGGGLFVRWEEHMVHHMKIFYEEHFFAVCIDIHIIYIDFKTHVATVQLVGNVVKMHQRLPLFCTRSTKSKRKNNKDHLWLINPIRREAIKIGSSLCQFN